MAKKKEQTFKFRSRSTFEVEAAISEHTATYVIGGQTITDKLEDFNAKFAPVDQDAEDAVNNILNPPIVAPKPATESGE
ncbi:MAG: hypothetical protein BWY95_00199 [Bacteroidetes bacterium ADurb.BinA104]|nr:MAG: hypothetical protein BWY95_00199 [Bacteroidetes bacterium ADurb.BinA104]